MAYGNRRQRNAAGSRPARRRALPDGDRPEGGARQDVRALRRRHSRGAAQGEYPRHGESRRAGHRPHAAFGGRPQGCRRSHRQGSQPAGEARCAAAARTQRRHDQCRQFRPRRQGARHRVAGAGAQHHHQRPDHAAHAHQPVARFRADRAAAGHQPHRRRTARRAGHRRGEEDPRRDGDARMARGRRERHEPVRRREERQRAAGIASVPHEAARASTASRCRSC